MPDLFNDPALNIVKQTREIFSAWYLPALGLGILLTPLAGQQPRYEPPPPPTRNYEVDIRVRYLLKPDVVFRGMGNIPFAASYETENNLFLGTERSIRYDDGFLAQDYINQQLIEGSDLTQLVESPNAAATANFAVANPNQLPADDPNAILFHRYAAIGDADREYKADFSGSLNWEINYTRYLNSKRRFGLQVGFGVTGFDSTMRESVSADLYIREYRHLIAQGVRPELPAPVENADGSTSQPPYTGLRGRDEVDSGNLLEWASSELSEEVVLDGATVDSIADLRSSIYNFRMGPVYNARLFQRMSVQVGAGVSAIFYSGTFGAYEFLNNAEGTSNPSRALSVTEDNEWQVGGYIDANARYRLNTWVDFVSGVQVHSGSTYLQRNEEREVNVDFRSHMYIHAGFGVKF